MTTEQYAGAAPMDDLQLAADIAEVNGNLDKIKLGEVVLTGSDAGTMPATVKKTYFF